SRRHTRCYRDWSSDVCSSDLGAACEARFVDSYLLMKGGRHTIAVRFPMREERTVESIVYQRHTIDWRGDQIVAMSPPQIPNPNMPPLPAPSLPMFPSCK